MIQESYAGPSNLAAYSGKQVRENLRELVSPLISRCGAAGPAAVCIGSAGISFGDAREQLRQMLKGLCPEADVQVLGDMEISLLANSADGSGILLISGTGSICLGRTKKGDTFRAGGWGHIASDDGSGYWIGLQAIRHTLRAADGMWPKALLYSRVLEEMGCQDSGSLVTFLSSPACTKARVAHLCEAVEACCLQGDPAAKEILAAAAGELFALVHAVAERMGFEPGSELPVFLGGSVLTRCRPLREAFERMMDAQFNARLKNIERPAAWGAARAAAEALQEDVLWTNYF